MMKCMGWWWGCLLLAGIAWGQDFSIRGATDKPVAIYRPGEPMEFTFRVFQGETAVAGQRLKWTRTGDDGLTEAGEGVAPAEGLKVTTSMGQPGFVRLQVKAFGTDGKGLQGYIGGWGGSKQGDIFFDGGACVEPEKLRPGREPADFDAFWAAAKARLAAVPVKADLQEVACQNAKIKLYAVRVECAGPKPVTGYLTVPANAAAKSLPAIVSFHGYGTGKHGPPNWFNEAALVFDINAHGMDLGRDDAYYAQLQKDLSGYCFHKEENTDREKTYYYGMALRAMRALQYVKTRPEWNGRELQSNGGSQGGLQGLWGAGLDADVTSSDIWSPWSCDFAGPQRGLLAGWRPEYTPALDYFDPVFHAARIRGRVHLVANYGDYTCAPSGVWIVYNQIPNDNKSMDVKQGCTHGYEMKQAMRFVLTPQGVKETGPGK